VYTNVAAVKTLVVNGKASSAQCPLLCYPSLPGLRGGSRFSHWGPCLLLLTVLGVVMVLAPASHGKGSFVETTFSDRANKSSHRNHALAHKE